MVLHLYCYRNKKAGFCGPIFSDNLEPKVLAEKLSQAILTDKTDHYSAISEDELYHVGTFDNISRNIVTCDEFILDCGAIYEQSKNLRSENENA